MANEQAARSINGAELKELILKDIKRILDGDAMFAPHIAYRRVSYRNTTRVMTDNPMLAGGYWENETKSIGSTAQQIEADASMAAVERHPLKGEKTEDYMNLGIELERKIDNPNMTRINNGLPVTVMQRQPNGQTIEEDLLYEPAMFVEGALEPDDVVTRVLSDAEIEAD